MWYDWKNAIEAVSAPSRSAAALARLFGAAACVLLLLHAGLAAAQQDGALALTVTPPLYQLSLSPGETWASTITVVNANPYDLTVHARAVNFDARGERGTGKFIPVVGTSSPQPPASWITITDEPIVIEREQTESIPFTVSVPDDAPPGGHYGAIIVGNRPEARGEGATLLISSSVASLLFLNIAGDIREDALIREFSTPQSVYQRPEVPLTLRFQNRGNVHVQPQGSITIYNMWGKERGRIDINQGSQFGNVLPGTIRNFTFTWKGEENAYEIGRYKAVVTLAYGSEARRNVGRVTYFWVVPIMPALYTLAGVLVFGSLLIWAVRAYIRRALALEAERLREQGWGATPAPPTPTARNQSEERHHHVDFDTFLRPLKHGVVDLRRVRLGGAEQGAVAPSRAREGTAAPRDETRPITLREFALRYAWFFALVFLLAFGLFFASIYFSEVLTYERDYEMTVDRFDGVEPERDQQKDTPAP